MDSSISGCSVSWSLVVVLLYCCLLSAILRVYWVRAGIWTGLTLRLLFWIIVNFLIPEWNVYRYGSSIFF